MHFGKTLQDAIYPPWRDHYIDYTKLKRLLREVDDDSDGPTDSPASGQPGARARKAQQNSRAVTEENPWTERDESEFVAELVNVQLEKVHNFQVEMSKKLKERTAACEGALEKVVRSDGVGQEGEDGEGEGEGEGKGKEKAEGEEEKKDQAPAERLSEDEVKKILRSTLKELDDISFHINQLQKFSRINFTGFLKAAKKHDRRSRTGVPKGKGKKKQDTGPQVRPLLQVRLSALEFNKEDYSPLLYRLSAMYAFVRQRLEGAAGLDEPKSEEIKTTHTQPSSSKKYTSHKFWIHPDNYLEVKTHIVRRLPVLVYNPVQTKNVDVPQGDPTISSLYFDNPNFSLYTDKVEKRPGAASLRIRWYGQLAARPELYLERKTMQSITSKKSDGGDSPSADAVMPEASERSVEERISLKDKYVESFLHGEYGMDKTVQKMRGRQDKNEEDVEKYEALVKDIQEFIRERDLQPMLRAVYNRSAFQIPGDDSVRISLDTNLAFIREDSLDPERPCRDPEDWHRHDVDDQKMEYPFSAINKGEIHRFPYALLEIKVRDDLPATKNAKWIHELMSSHLVAEAPRFSKFVHGVATLFDDHVNIFPFWLSEMNKDIRKDPKSAWQQEQERRAKQVENEFAVGSLKLPLSSSLGNKGGKFGWPSSLGGSQGSPSRFAASMGEAKFDSAAYAGSQPAAPPPPQQTQQHDEDTGSEDENDTLLPGGGKRTGDPAADERFDVVVDRGAGGTKRSLLDLFPGFSTSRYGARHRPDRRRRDRGSSDLYDSDSDSDTPLPPGVQKPETLLMHQTPVNVEPKVWLANQRTFIKWSHISVLLATLSLGLYNAAGTHNTLASVLGVVYTGIALFTGLWGYWVYIERSRLITERSGRDFDKKVGPIVVCVALAVALIVNFGFKFVEAKRRYGVEGVSPWGLLTPQGRNGTIWAEGEL